MDAVLILLLLGGCAVFKIASQRIEYNERKKWWLSHRDEAIKRLIGGGYTSQEASKKWDSLRDRIWHGSEKEEEWIYMEEFFINHWLKENRK